MRSPDAVPSGPQADYMFEFESFDDGRGGSVSFGLYGGDYQVEFYCQSLKGPEQENCISKEKAENFVRELMEEG